MQLNKHIFKLLLFVFLTSIFYDDPNLFLWKRLVYSLFLYISLRELFIIYRIFKQTDLKFPKEVKAFCIIYLVFIFINLIRTFFLPNFLIVSIINNPYALLSTVPVFAFGVGFYSSKENFVKVLKIICVLFLIFFFPNPYSKLTYFPGYICTTAIIPAFIFSIDAKRGTTLCIILILMALIFSLKSEYRIIDLNVMLFISMYCALNLFKKLNIGKILILISVCLLVFTVVTNLEDSLNAVGKITGSKFDSEDTRTFLFDELFADFKVKELFIGRGFLGTYYSPYFLQLQKNGEASDFYERFTVEVGYLELILKGGYVYVFLYMFPLVYTAIRGLFTKRISALSFNLSIYLIVGVLSMFFEYFPMYSFNFFMFFSIAGFIYKDIVDSGKGLNNVEYRDLSSQPVVALPYPIEQINMPNSPDYSI